MLTIICQYCYSVDHYLSVSIVAMLTVTCQYCCSVDITCQYCYNVDHLLSVLLQCWPSPVNIVAVLTHKAQAEFLFKSQNTRNENQFIHKVIYLDGKCFVLAPHAFATTFL